MQVWYVSLADNQLSAMPPELESVQVLYMSSNAITLANFSDLPPSLHFLYLAHNHLAGTLHYPASDPTSLC